MTGTGTGTGGTGTEQKTALARVLQGADEAQTPDITKVQAVAISQAIVAVLVLFGAEPTEHVTLAIAGISTALLIFLPLADALVRRERAIHAVEIANAKTVRAEAKKTTVLLKTAEPPLEVLRRELEAIKARSGPEDERPDQADDTAPGTRPKSNATDQAGQRSPEPQPEQERSPQTDDEPDDSEAKTEKPRQG